VIGEVADATVHDVRKAVRAATEAQASWTLTPARARSEILHRLPIDGRADRGAGTGDDPWDGQAARRWTRRFSGMTRAQRCRLRPGHSGGRRDRAIRAHRSGHRTRPRGDYRGHGGAAVLRRQLLRQWRADRRGGWATVLWRCQGERHKRQGGIGYWTCCGGYDHGRWKRPSCPPPTTATHTWD